MNKYSIRSIPAAAAMAAALLLGAQVHAQTGTTTPPGTSKSKDAVNPAPGNSATPARTDSVSPNGNPVANSGTMTPGTSKSKDNVTPEPSGGMAKSADQRTADKMAKADKKAAKKGARKARMAAKGTPPVDGVDTNKGGTK